MSLADLGLFKIYKRVVPTEARQLTQEDVDAFGGVIVSREGPKNFVIGDYVGRDELGMWVIRSEVIKDSFHPVSEPDKDGWTFFLLNNPYCRAQQMDCPFEVNDLFGRPGDYLVTNMDGDNARPVAQTVFETTRIEVTSTTELLKAYGTLEKIDAILEKIKKQMK